MINRIRIGNDINIEFTVLINKEKADLSDAKNIVVNVFREENIDDTIKLTGLDISSNPIKFTITGNLEHKSGLYRALITYNKSNPIEGEPDIYYAVDAPVFRLVSWSGQQQIGNEVPVIIPPILIEGLILQVSSSAGIGNGNNINGKPTITTHSELSHLGFNESGHTGFASEESVDQLASKVDEKAPINSPDFTGIPTTPTPDIANRTLQIANTTFVKNVINEHDKDVSAHSEIKTELIAQIETAHKIAEGASRAEPFDTIDAMQIWLTSPVNVAKLRVGDLFLIRQVDVPDFWWDGTNALELEVKLDLSDYYTKAIIDAKIQNVQNQLDSHNSSSTSHADIRGELTAKWVLLNELDNRSRNNSTRIAELDNFFDQLLEAYYDNGDRIVVLENELLGSAEVLTEIEGRL